MQCLCCVCVSCVSVSLTGVVVDVVSSGTMSLTGVVVGMSMQCRCCVQPRQPDLSSTRAKKSQTQYQNSPVGEWTAHQVCHWLLALGVDQYATAFRSNGVDGQQLLQLDGNRLKVRRREGGREGREGREGGGKEGGEAGWVEYDPLTGDKIVNQMKILFMSY